MKFQVHHQDKRTGNLTGLCFEFEIPNWADSETAAILFEDAGRKARQQFPPPKECRFFICNEASDFFQKSKTQNPGGLK
ncbi:MAG: hypothetical protein ACOC1Q_01875 [Desulfosalsimonas sp.]